MAEPSVEFPTPSADIAFVNGKVVTVNSRDEVTEALSLVGNRILRVGSRAYVQQTIGRPTRVVDLRGRAVVPGFTDNHIHMTNSPQRRWADCSYIACRSIPDISQQIAAQARVAPVGDWILGRGFQASRLAERRNPNRHDLDPVSPNHPVGIANREGMGWTFNTLGLRRVGVHDDTPDPPGGPMERDADGRPLGPMWDNTRTVFINPNLPTQTLDDLIDGYRWISGELNRHGVTAAFEAAIRNRMETVAWQRLRQAAPLTMRVVLGPYPLHGERWDPDGTAGKIFDTGFATGFGDAWLRLGALQMGIDGGVIGQTAALFEPYSNDPTRTRRGSFRVSQEVANDFMVRAQASSWQAGLICHGDWGISRALEAVAHGRRQAPGPELRHRLEHAYLWNPQTIDRMAELGLIWNTQPPILEVLGREGVYGQWGERTRFAFPFRSLADRGVIISGGSDWGVGVYNPFIGLDILVNHRFGPEEGGQVLNPDECLSVLQAIRVYTYNGAYTAFDERERGSLEEGKLADLALLSDDILSIPPTRIRDLQVDQTYVDGQLVYERASAG
ncbi:MAG TPA: amidohydrolase [Chloroflexota bacterium]|nr:amidohydrolase [Chloroflexota bacterium]